MTIFSSVQAQDSDLEVGLINVTAGSIVGGIGAVINKKDDEKFLKSLVKGMAQGALGGYAVFESKRLVGVFAKTENYNFIWPSKLLNSAGNSIIENAASNRNILQYWHIDLGFTRLDLSTENGVKIQYRIKPYSLYRAIHVWQGNKVDWNKSLKLGTMVFVASELLLDRNLRGATTGDHIVLNNKSLLETEAHELVHIYQYNQFSGVNTYLNGLTSKLEEKSEIFYIYNKFFYTDWNGPFFQLLLDSEKNYSNNIFEKEAYYLVK